MKCIAFDVGGTKISAAIVDDKGKLTNHIRAPIISNKKDLLTRLDSMIIELRANNPKLEGIAISIPGFVDKSGVILFGGGNLTCLENFNLKKYLEKKNKLPVFIENDANCFTLAESKFGIGKNYDVVLGIIWGTGIGSGLVYEGKLFKGAHGVASEVGHIVIDSTIKSDFICHCGFKGCVESFSGGKSISRRFYSLTKKDLTTSEILKSKDPFAMKVTKEAIDSLAKGLVIAINLYDPSCIVLGGGISKSSVNIYHVLQKTVNKLLAEGIGKYVKRNIKIFKHTFFDDAGLVGASILLFQRRQ